MITNSESDTMTFYTRYMDSSEMRLATKEEGQTTRFLINFQVGKLIKNLVSATPTDLKNFQILFQKIMTDYTEGRSTAHVLP